MSDPPCTARTIRSRKSQDCEADMGHLPADHNQPYGNTSADSTQPLYPLQFETPADISGAITG
jgi:hypothetical protein